MCADVLRHGLGAWNLGGGHGGACTVRAGCAALAASPAGGWRRHLAGERDGHFRAVDAGRDCPRSSKESGLSPMIIQRANRVAGRIALPPPAPPYMRVRVQRFLTVLADGAALFLCHGDRCLELGLSASTLRDKTIDGRVLPAKFSPSRVVRPSGLFVSGSLLSVLWLRLTPVPARRPLLTAVPAAASGGAVNRRRHRLKWA